MRKSCGVMTTPKLRKVTWSWKDAISSRRTVSTPMPASVLDRDTLELIRDIPLDEPHLVDGEDMPFSLSSVTPSSTSSQFCEASLRCQRQHMCHFRIPSRLSSNSFDTVRQG